MAMEVDENTLRKVKICIVSSCGGHLTEVRALKACMIDMSISMFLNDQVELPIDMREKLTLSVIQNEIGSSYLIYGRHGAFFERNVPP